MIRRDLARVTVFQFTRPRGARLRGRSERLGGRMVSIHAPTGGATEFIHCPLTYHQFQFTRPRGARRPRSAATAPLPGFQFTRPRGARHTISTVGMAREVSIHAPTGGATHDLHRGHGPRGFNSRAHGGRDASRARHPGRPRVSIHAPTGGATTAFLALPGMDRFQFTRPRGARRRRATRGSAATRFNSRAHGGRDGQSPRTGHPGLRFQFTRPRGARRQLPRARAGVHPVSIHAPTGGRDSRRWS